MDYSFFTKRVGTMPGHIRDNILARLVALGPNAGAIPRFSYKVEGVTAGMDNQLDALVALAKAEVMKIPEFSNKRASVYYAIHWLRAGNTIKEHTDIANGHSFDDLWIHKVHVPLVTDARIGFGFRRNLGEEVTWEKLEVSGIYMYNNVVFHQVTSTPECCDRAHLILYIRDAKHEAHFRPTKLWKE